MLKRSLLVLLPTVLLTSLLVLFFDTPYIDSSEIQKIYFSSSLFRLTENVSGFVDFGKEQGYLLFPTPILYLKIISTIKSGIAGYKIAQSILFTSSAIAFLLLSKEIEKSFKFPRWSFLISTLLFLTIPWSLNYRTYDLTTHLTLLTLIITFYVITTSKKLILLPILLLLLAFTQWVGLFMSVVLFLFAVRKNLITKSASIIFILTLCLSLVFNQTYILKTFRTSFFSELTPTKLTEEITEKAKVEYLSTNKELLPPQSLRKFLYNKPYFFLAKLSGKIISWADIEQWSASLDSYALIKRSGLSPKGNWPLIYPWLVIFVGIGALLLINKKIKLPAVILWSLPVSIGTYTLFDKKDLLSNQIILVPLVIYLGTLGFLYISKEISKRFPRYSNLIHTFFFVFVAISIFTTTKFFYSNKKDFRYTHGYFYYKIAQALLTYQNEYPSIRVTDRFGPTFLTSAFYLNLKPDKYWGQSQGTSPSFGNLNFEGFHISEGFEKGVLYIGLPGEFRRGIPDLPEGLPPSTFKLVGTIQGFDTPVTDYGDTIWMARSQE